jgi:hypothetical protein
LKKGEERGSKINNLLLIFFYLFVDEKWKTIILGRFLPSVASFDRVVPEEI